MDCSPPDFSVHEDSPGRNTGVGCHGLLQGIFPIQGSNPGLLHWGLMLYHLSHQGSPRILEWVAYPFSRGSSQPRNRTEVSCTAGEFFTNWAIREAPHLQDVWCPLSLSHVQLFGTPWTGAHQAPLSMRILQAGILEWIAMPSSRGSPQPSDWNQVSRVASRYFSHQYLLEWVVCSFSRGSSRTVQ